MSGAILGGVSLYSNNCDNIIKKEFSGRVVPLLSLMKLVTHTVII